MELVCFGSSSSGNCYWIELDRPAGQAPVRILLEAGLSFGDIIKKATAAGKRLADIDAVLISHNHADHSRSAKILAERGFRVYGNRHVCSSPLCLCEHKKVKMIAADTYVIPFLVSHDAESTFGYVINSGKEQILFFTDCAFFTADLSQMHFDYVLAEANYDAQVIHFAYEEAKKSGNTSEVFRYERLIKSHMSLSGCIKHLKKMNLSATKAIFLIHLSERHANRTLFKQRVSASTKLPVYVCEKFGGII